jgi:hypothetical protein
VLFPTNVSRQSAFIPGKARSLCGLAFLALLAFVVAGCWDREDGVRTFTSPSSPIQASTEASNFLSPLSQIPPREPISTASAPSDQVSDVQGGTSPQTGPWRPVGGISLIVVGLILVVGGSISLARR